MANLRILDLPAASTPLAETSLFELSLNGAGSRRLTLAQLRDYLRGFDAGPRNKLINGNFDIWQRATSVAAAAQNGFVADRWRHRADGSTVAVSRQDFTLGQTAVPGEPRHFYRAVVSSVAGANNLVRIGQTLESVRTLAGRVVTLSFWAKADSSKNMAVEFFQAFGTGGSPSATVTSIGVTTVALTSAWQRFVVTVTIPSIATRTIGTNNDDTFGFLFWLEAGSTFNARTNTLGQQSGTFDFARVQLEEGSVATPFEERPLPEELQLCQRYYEKSFALETAPAQAAGTANSAVFGQYVGASTNMTLGTVFFKVPKRGTPSVTLFNPSAANAQIRNTDGGSDYSGSIAVGNGPNSFALFGVTPAGSIPGHAAAVHWTADAEI